MPFSGHLGKAAKCRKRRPDLSFDMNKKCHRWVVLSLKAVSYALVKQNDWAIIFPVFPPATSQVIGWLWKGGGMCATIAGRDLPWVACLYNIDGRSLVSCVLQELSTLEGKTAGCHGFHLLIHALTHTTCSTSWRGHVWSMNLNWPLWAVNHCG